ncbi:hypothetical protein QBC46DRAFT_270499 [Diplogelasinospora grovesii]|uniref:Uncharacterized protein n=1 Tax=Diplogelasinospora grovesii TaxID=303347 RepID=A0AAN6MYS5_9PEZI|nr:hypothetical protein QBC46DRAFT_270499 [Diplogelasinospora grovesii]
MVPRRRVDAPRSGTTAEGNWQNALGNNRTLATTSDNTAAVRAFRPSHGRLEEARFGGRTPLYRQIQWPNDVRARVANGFSANYQGDITVPANRSANIPEELNCSLFLTGLPRGVTETELLACICVPQGRIYATVLIAAKGHRRFPAARVVFFNRTGAQALYDLGRQGQFVVRGQRVRVRYNSVRLAPIEGQGWSSRVILVVGPAGYMDSQALLGLFDANFQFQLDRVQDLGVADDGRRRLVIAFGSYRCQAEWARCVIRTHLGRLGVKSWFAPDPCNYLG